MPSVKRRLLLAEKIRSVLVRRHLVGQCAIAAAFDRPMHSGEAFLAVQRPQLAGHGAPVYHWSCANDHLEGPKRTVVPACAPIGITVSETTEMVDFV